MEVYTKMKKMEIKKGDLVEIICGGIEAKGKRGKVLAASPKNGTVVVEGHFSGCRCKGRHHGP